jgi:hypothetical protein
VNVVGAADDLTLDGVAVDDDACGAAFVDEGRDAVLVLQPGMDGGDLVVVEDQVTVGVAADRIRAVGEDLAPEELSIFEDEHLERAGTHSAAYSRRSRRISARKDLWRSRRLG